MSCVFNHFILVYMDPLVEFNVFIFGFGSFIILYQKKKKKKNNNNNNKIKKMTPLPKEGNSNLRIALHG